jgi:hypothetical protein
MKNLIILILFLIARTTMAQDTLVFNYFSLPNDICNCQDFEVEAYHQSILQTLDKIVIERRKLKPKRDSDEIFLRGLGTMAKEMATNRVAIRKEANNDYRRKIEPLHFQLAHAHEAQKTKLKAAIAKAHQNYCRKYTKRQLKLLKKQIGKLKAMRPWMDGLIATKNNVVLNGNTLTISDFDLYLMYLETLSKAYDYRLQPSERQIESD